MTQVADDQMAESIADSSWIDELRRRGAAQFESVGYPSTKSEEWRFTQLAPITRTRFRPAGRESHGKLIAETVAQFSFGKEAAAELVFVNGFFEPQLSRLGKLSLGVRVMNLAEAFASDSSPARQHLAKYAKIDANPFIALNTGSFRDGALVHVARGMAIEHPIHLLFVATTGEQPTVSHPRVLIVLEPAAQASVVESYCGAGEGVYLSNAVTEVVAGPGARIDHCKLQQESLSAFHVATMQVELNRSADFVSHSASVGSRITRNDLNVIMADEHAQATVNGLVLIGAEQHVDNHTMLDHASANCPSHELYKHVLDGKATGVFKGKILVRPGAQKTDSKQTSKTLLLSDDATMNSQPALEIYADDVKCTHGSTIGPVDEEQVFYLRSRGVGMDAARHLLTYAFAADITRRIKVEPVRRRLENLMAAQHGLPQDLRITDLGAHDEAARNS
jgi:Fe-S cluster assembly protein SufD